MGPFDGLSFRLFGADPGAWYLLANEETLHSATGKPWSRNPGRHPWVLISEYSGGPTARMRPRTSTGGSGLVHKRHPPSCEETCRINKPGWIPTIVFSIKGSLLRDEDFSCNEPDQRIRRLLEAS
jgi:hypothetical protein